MQGNQDNILKKINRAYFLKVIDDDGRTVFYIPTWAVLVTILGIIFLVRALVRARQSGESE